MNPLHTSVLFLTCLATAACRASAKAIAPPRQPFYDARAAALRATAKHAPAVSDSAEQGEFPSVTGDLAHSPSRLWNDTKLVFTDGSNLLWLALAATYNLLTENYVEEREATFFRKHTIYGRDYSNAIALIGNGATLYAGVLTWYFVARNGDHWQSYEASKTVLSAMTITAATTGLLKVTISDGRPGGGSQDFPSGHTSMSMSVAASLDELYGHTIGYIGYGLTTLVALQRLDSGKHDTGSVVFAAVLGYVTGKTVARHHAPRIFGMDVGFVRDPDSGAPGISLSRSF